MQNIIQKHDNTAYTAVLQYAHFIYIHNHVYSDIDPSIFIGQCWKNSNISINNRLVYIGLPSFGRIVMSADAKHSKCLTRIVLKSDDSYRSHTVPTYNGLSANLRCLTRIRA